MGIGAGYPVPEGPDFVREGRRPGTQAARASERRPKVSLVIPVYNAEASIERCLESALAQEAPFDYEVVVADSSTDRTPEIIAERFPEVRYVRLARRAFPGTARNAAIREAGASYVAMIDADCVADPHMLARMVERLDSGDYAAVGGAICNGTPGNLSGLVSYLLEFREFIPTAPRREVFTIPTANICYRREVFERYGLFHDVRAGEDLLFNWRLLLSDERILFDPEIRVTHLNRTGWRHVVGYQSVLGRGSAAARRMMDPPLDVVRAYPAQGWFMPYLVRFPALALCIPPVRLARALAWLARYDRKAFAWLLLLSPMYLAAALVWAAAFVRGLRDAEAGQAAGAQTQRLPYPAERTEAPPR
jgi:cellulose synthase/poly-beta-1,6-N-acetylglucosamine synthase-like glycosyltransferase